MSQACQEEEMHETLFIWYVQYLQSTGRKCFCHYEVPLLSIFKKWGLYNY